MQWSGSYRWVCQQYYVKHVPQAIGKHQRTYCQNHSDAKATAKHGDKNWSWCSPKVYSMPKCYDLISPLYTLSSVDSRKIDTSWLKLKSNKDTYVDIIHSKHHTKGKETKLKARWFSYSNAPLRNLHVLRDCDHET
jgi:hypothetical protein